MKNSNNIDKDFIIRQAKLSDQFDLMSFIQEFWKPNHILGTDKDFFAYEHITSDKINFFIAVSKSTKEIIAIQGFIPYDHYPGSHICGVITKVHPKKAIPLLGIELMRRMLDHTQPSSYCGIGTNPKTMIPLVKKFFKRNTGIMDHFCLVNHEIDSPKILTIPTKTKIVNQNKNNHHEHIEKNNFNLINKEEIKECFHKLRPDILLPKKSLQYIFKRYFNHPKYSYGCIAIDVKNGTEKNLLITREISYNNTKALRIIDFIGNIKTLGKLKDWLFFIMKNNNYEYIDILCSGIDKATLQKSGFFNKNDIDGIIIPTYFEPFVNENIDIHYEKSSEKMILFKGDADGDRPNL